MIGLRRDCPPCPAQLVLYDHIILPGYFQSILPYLWAWGTLVQLLKFIVEKKRGARIVTCSNVHCKTQQVALPVLRGSERQRTRLGCRLDLPSCCFSHRCSSLSPSLALCLSLPSSLSNQLNKYLFVRIFKKMQQVFLFQHYLTLSWVANLGWGKGLINLMETELCHVSVVSSRNTLNVVGTVQPSFNASLLIRSCPPLKNYLFIIVDEKRPYTKLDKLRVGLHGSLTNSET